MTTPLDRRSFLGRAAAAAGGFAAARVAGDDAGTTVFAQGPGPTAPAVANIGLQLYTVSSLVQQDLVQALEAVAKVGYKVVEFAGYGKRPHAETRAALDRLGMTSPSTHISLAALRKEFDAQVAIAETIGHRYITVPSLGGDMPTDADGWKKMADEFNAIGARLAPRKIGLGFHSHRDEFLDVDGGKKGMDIFIAETDPALVTFEIDLGWAAVAGENPVDWFKRYPGRVKMWHVKDILALAAARERQVATFAKLSARSQGAAPVVEATQAAPGGRARGGGEGGRAGGGRTGGTAPAPAVTGGPVPVGAGEIDFRPAFAEWKVSGLEYFFVEQDGAANWPGGPVAAIATSYRNLVNLLT
jgi:sugar phosphate isomerase/epimerase